MNLRNEWAKPDWFELIDHAYQKLKLPDYKVRGPLTITHGDPHLENIFNYLYIDHTTMMLAWEIEKYFQGYTSEARIKDRSFTEWAHLSISVQASLDHFKAFRRKWGR